MSLSAEDSKKVGGSDAAALVGLNPYATAIDVYRRIVEGYETPETAPMRRGILLEPVIREMYRLETGALLKGPRKLSHPQLDFIRANLDDVAVRGGCERVAEFKSASVHMAPRWGEGGDDVPEHYLPQTQWYMACAGIPFADLAVLIGGDELRIYELRADLEFQSLLFEAAERFWKDNVLKRVPPAVDASDSCAEWLATRFPRNGGGFVKADPEAERWAERLRAARASVEIAEAAEKEARNHLIEVIGEADGLEGETFRITHKLVKGRAKTDWEAIAREAHVPASLVEKYTTIGAGYRRFTPKFAEDNKS